LTSADAAYVAWDPTASELRIDWSHVLGHDCELRVAGWHDRLVATTRAQDEVSPIDLASLGDWFYQLDEPAVLEWENTIPRELVRAIDRLPSSKLPILKLSRALPPAADLLASNPLLLWLLYRHCEKSPLNQSGWTALLRHRQRDLLEHLGVEGTVQKVNILRNFSGKVVLAQDVNSLVELLADAAVCNYLAHTKTRSANEIRVLRKFPWIAACKARALLPDLVDPQARRDFSDTVELLEDLAPLQACRSVAQMRRLHERLVDELNRRPSFKLLIRNSRGETTPFPSPPVPGATGIDAIRCQQDLIHEGHSMRHCIATYIPRVLRGKYYVYSGKFDSRVTIGVAIDSKGRCSIGDIRGERNEQASAETEAAWVREWPSSGEQSAMLMVPT
jgi:hypothetical protein